MPNEKQPEDKPLEVKLDGQASRTAKVRGILIFVAVLAAVTVFLYFANR